MPPVFFFFLRVAASVPFKKPESRGHPKFTKRHIFFLSHSAPCLLLPSFSCWDGCYWWWCWSAFEQKKAIRQRRNKSIPLRIFEIIFAIGVRLSSVLRRIFLCVLNKHICVSIFLGSTPEMGASNLLFLFIFLSFGVFGFGLEISENDIHNEHHKNPYPEVCVSIGIKHHAHTLPYLMGLIENLRYPKNKIRVLFVAQEESDGDTIDSARM